VSKKKNSKTSVGNPIHNFDVQDKKVIGSYKPSRKRKSLGGKKRRALGKGGDWCPHQMFR